MDISPIEIADNYGKEIKGQLTITGKGLLPYYIPKEIKINCTPKKCDKCEIFKIKEKLLIIKKNDKKIVNFVNINEDNFGLIFQEIFDIKCKKFTYEIVSVYHVEEIYFFTHENTKDERIGYIFDTTIEYNTPYIFHGYVRTDPKTQKINYIITMLKKIKTSIDSFSLTKKQIKQIKNLYPDTINDNKTNIYDFLQKLYNIYSNTITKIYKRFDLHLAIDLVFFSALDFSFNNEHVKTGWLDVMIIGDTRCGKGYVAESLVKYYELGEIVSGENVSIAGLIGGIKNINGRHIISWGILPQNDKKMVIIDEAGTMTANDFVHFSRVRSEGICEITKIKTEKTYARTRLLFIGNPKNRMMATYSYGIQAITDITNAAKDIARFDYILCVSQTEVDLQTINQIRHIVDNPYQNVDKLLIQWAWSKKHDNIIFHDDALNLILSASIELGQQYSPQIPLIQGENIRLKLARIAVAFAMRLFSTDEQAEFVIVKKTHVEATLIFLDLIYKKNASGYFYYSKLQKQNNEIEDKKVLEDYFNIYEHKEDIIDYFIRNNYINVTDLSEHINSTKDVAKEIISKLLKHRCIIKKYTFYVKCQCFTEWLKKQ